LVFRELIHSHFVGPVCDTTPTTLSVVTQHEGNALRYAGGYVCRHLHKKIKQGNQEFKEQLLLCLMALIKDDSSGKCGNEEE